MKATTRKMICEFLQRKIVFGLHFSSAKGIKLRKEYANKIRAMRADKNLQNNP
jgi:hypothetical protein